MTVIHWAAACGLASLLLAGPASALTTTYGVVAGGLADGHACLSSADPGACAAEALFTVPSGSFAASGTLSYDDTAGTVDIDLTVTTASMTGSHAGVEEVVFSTAYYGVADWAVSVTTIPFTKIQSGVTTATGSAAGWYSGLDAGASTVEGPTGFNETTVFSGLQCTIFGTGGVCGFIVGGSRDFNLSVGGDPVDVRHNFNFSVNEIPVPEPGAGALLATGLLLLVARRR